MLKNCLLYSGNSLRLVGSSTKEGGVNIVLHEGSNSWPLGPNAFRP